MDCCYRFAASKSEHFAKSSASITFFSSSSPSVALSLGLAYNLSYSKYLLQA